MSVSKRVKDKDERLQGRSAALVNIGLIYSDLGKSDEALEYLNKALEIDRRIGYKRGIANALGNIGNIYSGLGVRSCFLLFFTRVITRLFTGGDTN